mmetsp:Transcript_29476/g.68200  ORF Transcript_29476/g.68200 Transcript_29476/m.68200 type:complete len:251 (+) Transcript_29476:465-1217(+)
MFLPPLFHVQTQTTSHSSEGTSRPFRQTLFLLMCMNFLRNVFLPDPRFLNCTGNNPDPGCNDDVTKWLFYAMTAVESVALSFLQLLMPYLLQCKLKDYINIQPGRGLLPWLYAILALNFTGVVLAVHSTPNMWCIKRVGDSLSCIPTIQTVRLYSRITNHPANSNSMSQGFFLIQALLVIEYWLLVSTLLASLGYFIDDHGTDGNEMWRALRVAGIFTSHLAGFVHGLMLNMVDEAQFRLAEKKRFGWRA